MSFDVSQVKAMVYDVFGTVVDWRNSIIRDVSAVGERLGVEGNWNHFADRWRGGYHDGQNNFRAGTREWLRADDMHRERLHILIDEFGLTGLSDDEFEELNKAWHRLDPWPDAVEGLTRLKTKYIVGTLSNGNIGLLVNMAKWGGLPWDVILAGENFQSYKPDHKVYLGAADILGLKPNEVMMCAAHLHDLHAAAEAGLSTGFIARPTEYGDGERKPDLKADDSIDVAADTYLEFAEKMGT